MTSKTIEPAVQHPPLGAEGEELWQQLRKQIEWSDRFWVGFIFTPSPPASALLRQRARRTLRAHARKLRVILPKSALELREALPALFEESSKEAGHVWLEAIRADAEWMPVWEHFFLRLNGVRERLRRWLPEGALVVVAPPAVKPLARDAAPDLWSIRSLVLEPPAVAIERPAFRSSEPDDGDRPIRLPAPSLGPLDISAEAPPADVMESLREAEGLLVQGQAARAIAAAARAVERLESLGRKDLLANALATLARAEATEGDAAAAIEHIRRAIELRKDEEHRSLLLWYELWQDLALRRLGDLRQAAEAAQGAHRLSCGLVEREGASPESLRDLAISLDMVGKVHAQGSDWEATRAAYEESLSIRRRLLAVYGESLESLRDLFISLNKVGQVHAQVGDWEATRSAYEESLSITRRLLDAYGESLESLRDLFVSLDKVGQVHAHGGDWEAARSAYEESLSMARRLLDAYGESPESLRDLSVSLEKVGDVHAQGGDWEAARAAYEESLSMARRLLDAYGASPESLRDLSVSLEKVGDVHAQGGDWEAARAAYEESLSIARRLLDAYGEHPLAIQDLRIVLENLLWVRQQMADTSGAAELRAELDTLLQRLEGLAD